MIEVREKAEPLYEVSADSARHLLLIAWQLGDRHLEVQLFGERIIIRRDRAIKTMLEGLGATIREIEAPFDPEEVEHAGTGDDPH